MSDIFYTEVDANLQIELLARAAAGFHNRRNADINYMVSKIANVTLVPYETADKQNKINEAILGGVVPQTKEYLPTGPNGFLSDRKFDIIDEKNGGPVDPRTNTSKRIPPYLTAVDIQIGDDSMGVMQTATIAITIPNPGRDLNYFESVYMRPGRAVTVSIDHPTTAIITKSETEGLLTDKVMPSTEKIKKLYPNLTPDQQRKYQKMNSFIFDGLVTSFTLDYQQDASVAASLTIRGKTQVYTDISMIMSDFGKKDDTNIFGETLDPELDGLKTELEKNEAKLKDLLSQNTPELIKQNKKEINNLKTNIGNQRGRISEIESSRFIATSEGPVANTEAAKEDADVRAGKKAFSKRRTQFADKMIGIIATQKNKNNNEPGSTKDLGVFIDKSEGINKDVSYIWGSPGENENYEDYISLKALIEFLNNLILDKLDVVTGESTKIIMDSEINASKHYKQLRSADPENIFFPRQDNYGGRTWYKDLDNIKPKFIDRISSTPKPDTDNELTTLVEGLDTQTDVQTSTKIVKTTLIYINIKFIQNTIFDVLDADNGTVSSFLKKISEKIYYASGGAYQMSLITHPEQQSALLYYDTNNVKGFSNVPKEFDIPMFANHPAGTVVKDFTFNGKLPSDASTLAYVLNQDPAEISESDVAPFLSYMYSANTVERSGPNETIKNIITQEVKDEIDAKYEKRHKDYKTELTAALNNYNIDRTNDTQKALLIAMKNYVQYPTPTIQDTNKFKAPVIPFDVSFTIEGINGFRYGDVLQFKGLPDRYTINTVFSIIGINHSVSTQGEWNTEIRCIMRPRIE